MNTRTTTVDTLLCATWLLLSVYVTPGQRAWAASPMIAADIDAAELNCSTEEQVSRQLANGSTWSFCWHSRVRENLVLSDVHYTSPHGETKRILASASLGQLHVAYDDSDVTYSDVTQYGLGGAWLQELSEEECVYGERLYQQSRASACLWEDNAAIGGIGPFDTHAGSSLNIYSVSQVGAYTYLISWRLHDDGAIEPGIGATGALQRSSADLTLPFGRVLSGDDDTLWLSHTHNYYWRLDFDIGLSAFDDQVSEVSWPGSINGQTMSEVVFNEEAARTIMPNVHRGWQIHESRIDDQPSRARWHIDPYRYGQRFVRPDVEAFTANDFFVTVANDCERFASQNARFNPDCLNDVSDYVNGQSLDEQDIVVWHRVSFHHVPKNEDQRNMHTHWDGFVIRPLDVFDDQAVNTPPLLLLSDRNHSLGETISDQLAATDADGDALVWMASNLPTGIRLDRQGRLTGVLASEGNWQVVVQVFDGKVIATQRFNWRVGTGTIVTGGSGGGLGWLALFSLIALYLPRATAKSDRLEPRPLCVVFDCKVAAIFLHSFPVNESCVGAIYKRLK